MERSTIINRLLLLVLPIALTGCYTQFQTYDRFPLEEDRYADYNAWDDFEEKQKEVTYDEASYLDEELYLEENDIYFRDYETQRWYNENFANKLYWEGYGDGYQDGYSDGWADYYPASARYSMNRYRYLYGYTGAFEYLGFYGNPYYPSAPWLNFGFHNYTFSIAFHAGWGRYYNTYYDHYWGHPYYSFHSYGYAYNYYHKSKKYNRDADLYRKGPRSTGLVNRQVNNNRPGLKASSGNNTTLRSRSGSTITTRNRGLNRSSGTSTGSRVRSSGNVGKSSSGSVGRGSTNNRSRGSSVGTSRGNGSRSSGSSVGNKRSSSGSNSSGARSRGNDDSNVSNRSSLSSSVIGVSRGTNERVRTYTIPTRRVVPRDQPALSRRAVLFGTFRMNNSGSGNIFKSRFPSSINNTRINSGTSRSFMNSRSNNSSSKVKSSSRSGSNSKVERSSSSSSSRSSGSRGSSSSSKRNRGGN